MIPVVSTVFRRTCRMMRLTIRLYLVYRCSSDEVSRKSQRLGVFTTTNVTLGPANEMDALLVASRSVLSWACLHVVSLYLIVNRLVYTMS